MNIKFNINYATKWGESVAIELSTNNLAKETIKLTFVGGETWSGDIHLDDIVDTLQYNYLIVDSDTSMILRREYGEKRTMSKSGLIELMECIDSWHDQPTDKPLCSSAFIECINRPNIVKTAESRLPGSMSFRIHAPSIPQGKTLAVVGNIPSLGAWDPTKAIEMANSGFPEWECQFPVTANDGPIEYKFIVVDQKNPHNIEWEKRDNRHITSYRADGKSHVAVECEPLISVYPKWRGAGTAIPVFSLRTNDDFGVGDFYGLKKLADWCAATGQRFIQVLPVNDTTMNDTWMDSYPYNANSSFALHPIYLHLPAIGTLAEPARRDHYARIANELNSLPVVDYEKVSKAKELFARELFAQYGEETMSSNDYRVFVNENKEWLTPYVAYRILCRLHKTSLMADWGEYAVYSPVKIARFIEANRREANFHTFVQYHLSKQMRHVRDYAHSLGVALKGDIPIGIARTSVDAWVNPRLYNMDCQAGAPPDAFSAFGQNWGFPTYNWEIMARDGYSWWKSRFRTMAKYFDAYRIDHVLGFFRIWQIPTENIHGLLGHFYPSLPYTAAELANDYDFTLKLPLHTEPYIVDHILSDYFGDYVGEAIDNYLTPIESSNRYRLVASVDTQRKVASHFAQLPDTKANQILCQGLMSLIDNVLFIEDPQSADHFHPRINAQFTDIYRSMSEHEKCCFDRLYNNFYYHRNNDFWREKALEKLPPLISSTNMLVCAEDLGMIPACVPEVLRKLEILSLEIQRMPKAYNREFDNPAEYPYLSVCTTSTHDMGGIRVWWEEDRSKTQSFFNNVLGHSGEAPIEAEPWICDEIIESHLASPAMLCILPLQDWLSMDGTLRRDNPNDEIINIPANPRHYWQYRMHHPIETLLRATEYNARIREKIERSGRDVHK